MLESLRPQVDRLHVYLNGYETVPPVVAELADEFSLDTENRGAERKFWWADRWDGIYLSTDDDIVYPADYVRRMVAAVEHREGAELVTCHGRVYRPDATRWHQCSGVGMFHMRVDYSRNCNGCGTGVLAFDARKIDLPTEWPEKNMADLQVAAWAQRNRVPVWLLAHQAHWFTPLALIDKRGIFASSQRERHERRNAILKAHRPWRVWVRDGSGTVIEQGHG